MRQLKYVRSTKLDHEKIKPNQIAAARVLLDITQNQLADLSGISASTVKRISPACL